VRTSPPWFLSGPPASLDTSDPDVRSTARHEAAHVAAAHLLGWEIHGVRLKADGGGDADVVFPRGRDRARRHRESVVICLAARAHVGWRRFDSDAGDRRQAYKALENLAGDSRRARMLMDAARDEARQLAATPKFRQIAERVTQALLEQGRLGPRELEPLLGWSPSWVEQSRSRIERVRDG